MSAGKASLSSSSRRCSSGAGAAPEAETTLAHRSTSGAGGVVVQSTLPGTSNRDEDSDLGGCTSRCCSTVSVSRPRLPRGPQQQQLTSHSTLLYSVDLLFTTLPANSSLHYSSLISFRPVHFLPDTARGTTIVRGSLNLLRDFHQRLGNLHFPYG